MVAEFSKYLDVNYSLNLMDKLISFQSNPELGYRTSGSAAELKAADYLYDEMKRIGLENVRKEGVTVDNFEFKHADLKYKDALGKECKVLLAAYQARCHKTNEKIEIIYVGKGQDFEYSGKNVEGKFVLIDIDMINDWWMNWPLMQARFKGAAGVIMVNVAGYCSCSEDTLGAQDISAPASMPAFSMTVRDANVLKQAIKSNGGKIEALLNADVSIRSNGLTYDVIGEIPGKVNEVVYLTGHYDAYFKAFSDNTSGVGCIMGICRAFIKSGYKPQRTLRVCLHGAEEWGAENTRYDWAIGATRLTQKHPEWGENGFLLCNLDCSLVSSNAKSVNARTSYEMERGMKEIGSKIEGSIYPFETNSPLWTWTESYVYSKLGIPTIESSYDGVNLWGCYHSDHDTKEVNHYSDEAFISSHVLYGTLVQEFDKLAVRPINFTDLFAKLTESLDDSIIGNTQGLRYVICMADEAAKKLNAKAERFKKLDLDAVKFNRKVSRIYAKAANELFGLDWYETYDFIHVRNQHNIGYLIRAIEDVKKGDVAAALDDEIRNIDLNWQGYNFDKRTYDFIVDQVLGKDAVETWAKGKVKTHADLWQVGRDLWAARKSGKSSGFEEIIGKLEIELARQRGELGQKTVEEINILEDMTAMMEDCCK